MLTHKGTQTIVTQRLKLRPFEIEDAEAMFLNWASDPEVTKFLTWAAHTRVEDTKNYIERCCVGQYYLHTTYKWAIELRGSTTLMGDISVVGYSEKNHGCELGYCLSRSFWGQGLMTEALSAILGYLFSVVNFNRIEARHDIRNPASGKVMLKCGMQFEGTLRQVGFREQEGYYDLQVYSMLKNDWDQSFGGIKTFVDSI